MDPEPGSSLDPSQNFEPNLYKNGQAHYKLPLGPIWKLDEHKIIFFEVLLEGFDANKAKKFEKQSFFNMEK